MDAKTWNKLKKHPDKAKKMLKDLGMPSTYLKIPWEYLSNKDQAKVEQWIRKNASGWFEIAKLMHTDKGIRNVAPRHYDAAKKTRIKKLLKDTLRQPITIIAPKLEQRLKAIEEYKEDRMRGMLMTPILEVVFWDVQHGSATYIKTPNGTHIVQDLGTGSYEFNNKEFSPLLHLKNKYEVNQLDHVIITHPHKDHIDDIMNFDKLSPRVLSRPNHLSKDEIMKNVREEDKYQFEKYFQIDKRYSSPVESGSDPSLPMNNGDVKIQTFIPNSCSLSNINNHSIVTVLSYADSKVVLTGDNEPPSWKELLEKDNFKNAIKNADILLAPHHGRDSGFYSELFDYFKPKLTIISDGHVCDTSATDRYSKISTGWTVHHKSNGKEEKRNCVTTRNDGVIVLKLGYNPDERPFIYVKIA